MKLFNNIYLDLLWESGAEHHSVSDAFWRHCILLNNASNLWFKSHIQHAVCLIQDQVTTEKHLKFLKTKQTWHDLANLSCDTYLQ